MKRLVCLMCAMVVVACGTALPAAPPYIGTDEYGVRYFIDSDAKNIDLAKASEQMRLTVEALGGDLEQMRGVSISYTTRQFQCGGNWVVDGCYNHGPNPNITLLVWYPECPYVTPLAHELWHHLGHAGREPTVEEGFAIQQVNQKVWAKVLAYCPPSF